MRSGELRGLQHQDLDPRTGRVSIQRTRTQGVTGPAKTARSVRQAAITHPTCEATAAWRPGATPERLTVLSRLAQLVPLDGTAPLFGSLKHPGRPMEERELHTLWHRTLTRARVRPAPRRRSGTRVSQACCRAGARCSAWPSNRGTVRGSCLPRMPVGRSRARRPSRNRTQPSRNRSRGSRRSTPRRSGLGAGCGILCA